MKAFDWLLVSSALAVSAAEVPTYELHLKVDPTTGTLQGDCTIRNWPEGCRQFHLAKGLRIERLEIDGRSFQGQHNLQGKPMAFTVDGFPVPLPAGPCQNLRVRYRGQVSSLRDQWHGMPHVNGVSARLVELACYSGWYPMLSPSTRRHFRLTVDLPPGWVATANGKAAALNQWRSETPVEDICLVASPDFKVVKVSREGFEGEAYHTRLDPKRLEAQLRGLAETHGRLASRFGSTSAPGAVRFVYSPRESWAYSRAPIFIVSEAEAQKAQADPSRHEVAEFRNASHEMAHFWWSLAPVGGSHDWINEGLAEFTAFQETRTRYGTPQSEKQLEKYRKQVAGCKGRESILDCAYDSRDRMENLYLKPTLLLLVLEKRVGTGPLDASLRRFHSRFKEGRNADTDAFLAHLRQDFGTEAIRDLEADLRSPGWTPERLESLVAQVRKH